MSKTHPILFSTPMVQAILDGRKTMTRRTIKPQPNLQLHNVNMGYWSAFPDIISYPYVKCPYGKVGDVLWVRESFRKIEGNVTGSEHDYEAEILYAADNSRGPFKPSIHMPKEACRLFLKITDVRVERLQDIYRGDCMAEGCPFPNIAKISNPKQWFSDLWKSINGPDSWEANPFVWVISFERTKKPHNF